MNLAFLRLAPPRSLATEVENFWFMRGAGPKAMPEGHRILPDGCMEFVFQLGDPFLERTKDGSWRLQSCCLLVGQMEHRVDIRPKGRIHTVGVHFHPAGARAFVRGDLKRFANRIVDLESAIGGRASAVLRRLGSARSHDAQAKVLATFLESRREPGDSKVEALARRLSVVDSIPDMKSLAREFDTSERQLRRRFESAVGLAPKKFSRLVRFQRVFEKSEETSARAWSQVALDCGYYDQAHFNRDFKAFTGVPPRELLKDVDPLTRFFLSVSSKTAKDRRV